MAELAQSKILTTATTSCPVHTPTLHTINGTIPCNKQLHEGPNMTQRTEDMTCSTVRVLVYLPS
jgi:hypothetical protein